MSQVFTSKLFAALLAGLCTMGFITEQAFAAPDPEKKLKRIETQLEKGGQPLDAEQKEALEAALSAGQKKEVEAILTAEQIVVLEERKSESKNKDKNDKKGKKGKKNSGGNKIGSESEDGRIKPMYLDELDVDDEED